jgi:hypothetical protein
VKVHTCGVLLALLLLSVQASADSLDGYYYYMIPLLFIILFLFALFICSAHMGTRSRILLSLYLLGLSIPVYSLCIVNFILIVYLGALLLGFMAVLLGAFMGSRIKKITSRCTQNRWQKIVFLTVLSLLGLFSVIILAFLSWQLLPAFSTILPVYSHWWAALFSMILFFYALIIYSAHIGKRSRIWISLFLVLLGFFFIIYNCPADYWTGLTLIPILGLLAIFLSAVLGFPAYYWTGLLLIPILGLPAIFLGAVLERIVKNLTVEYTKNPSHKRIFLTVFALLALFSMMTMIIIDFPAHRSFVTSTGWVTLTPQGSNTWYNARNQTFTATFMNNYDTRIKILEVDVNETPSNVTCTVTAPSEDTIINQGETFRFVAVCATANKKDRDSCDMRIKITYDADEMTWYGNRNGHTESGNMKGIAEA